MKGMINMAVRVLSACYEGVVGELINVEVDITRGLPGFNMVGLADISVKEAKERVRSSIINSGYEFPISRITVNLAPADIKKVGSLFDLPIAIGILLATGQLNSARTKDSLFLGELSLMGEIKSIKGGLAIALEAGEKKIKNLIVPIGNERECSIVKKLNVLSFNNLRQVVNFIKEGKYEYKSCINVKAHTKKSRLDYAEIYGQESNKRAIEVAAAGFHNLIFYGPPGSGKSMLASRLPSILPKLTYEEAIEVTKIYSISGKLSDHIGLVTERPFRSPHHTISKIALVGGGSKLLPGEISLAHNGVLFLDEILEFKKEVLDVLRQPLEEKTIHISRITGEVIFPCECMLIAAMNPCRCGNYGSEKLCTCSDLERKKYLHKISGPLLNRIDIISPVKGVSFDAIGNEKKIVSSKIIRDRVENARKIQRRRFKGENILYNAQMNEELVKKFCILDQESKNIMEKIYNEYFLSLRAYSKILKVSRTLADLEENEFIGKKNIIEALNYRRFIDESII